MNKFALNVDTSQEKLNDALGVSEERAKYLHEKFQENVDAQNENGSDKGDISSLLAEVSTHCETASELAFASYMVGGFVEHMNNQARMHQMFTIGNSADLINS